MCLCPICESAGNTEFFLKEDRPLLICRNCRHVWWRDLPSETELSDYYRTRYTQAHSQETIQAQAREYYRNHLCELAAIVNRRPQEARLMDYGCSIPVLAHEAVKLSFSGVLGVDWAEEAKEWGRTWGVEVLTPSELGSIPDQSIDIVRLSHTIEHSVEPMAVLRSLTPKVRSGGLIYITQPNFPVFRPRRSNHDLLDTVYPEHLHFFSALSLIEMVSRLSLCVIRFFSHQKEAEVVSKYREMIDLDYARERLAAYASRGDVNFPDYANYPYYAGENSVLHALVRR
jgi:2-polyprenyl-3-methyl-5-hydroxy-6-metoxy-1,4-benzoquinol methylase